MTCELWRDQITAYVDGELAASHDDEVSRHLQSCGECTLYAASEIHLKRGVGHLATQHQPSPELRANVLRAIGAEPKPSSWFKLWVPLGVAAAVLLAASSLFFVARGGRQDVAREIADLHLSTISSANPVDVISTDQHTVKPWFAGKIPFTFNLPELANSPFTLLGGRVVYLHETPAALLLFQYKKHFVTVLIGPARVLGSGSGEQSLPNGFHEVRWTRNGYAYVTTGDPAMDTLKDLSQRMQAVAN